MKYFLSNLNAPLLNLDIHEKQKHIKTMNYKSFNIINLTSHNSSNYLDQ